MPAPIHTLTLTLLPKQPYYISNRPASRPPRTTSQHTHLLLVQSADGSNSKGLAEGKQPQQIRVERIRILIAIQRDQNNDCRNQACIESQHSCERQEMGGMGHKEEARRGESFVQSCVAGAFAHERTCE